MAEITASTKKREPSKEEMMMILRGERPDWMDYDLFKSYRKNSQMFTKNHLKGKYLHVSKELRTEEVDGKKRVVSKNYGPYVKKTENE